LFQVSGSESSALIFSSSAVLPAWSKKTSEIFVFDEQVLHAGEEFGEMVDSHDAKSFMLLF
jgi:hypothetical protein